MPLNPLKTRWVKVKVEGKVEMNFSAIVHAGNFYWLLTSDCPEIKKWVPVFCHLKSILFQNAFP